MDSVIVQLANQSVWEKFLAYRLMKKRLTWRGFLEADSFVADLKFMPVAKTFLDGVEFPIPQKRVLNKMGTGKKRVVYTYGKEEMDCFKLINCLLYKYDCVFAPNCYAFRVDLTALDAVRFVHENVSRGALWVYKLDIHDYFNSISPQILLPLLADLLCDDCLLYGLFEQILNDKRIIVDGKVAEGSRGVLPGVPTASFLANVYLNELDHYFYERGVLYARYSDDIIVFAEDFKTLQKHKVKIIEFLSSYKLTVNPAKEKIFPPNEPCEFLGFSYMSDKVDVSSAGIKKIKGKIRRKMRSILRWKRRNCIAERESMSRMIKCFNHKFFGENNRAQTWSRWFFPVVNTIEGMREIDHYLQQCIRVISTGHHSKSNYRVTYSDLKEMGYRSLVHEYYKRKKQRVNL